MKKPARYLSTSLLHALLILSNSVSIHAATDGPPAITTPPVGQTVRAGQNATFYVVAAGDALTYQWRKDGADIPGATGATYNTGPAQTNMAGAYTVVVSNSFGSITSAPPVTLTVQPGLAGGVFAWDFYEEEQYVPPEAQSGVTAISVGNDHLVALKEDGSVIAWGDNSKEQTNVPEAARSGVTAIAAGSYFTLALKADGSVLAWGDNSLGQTEVPAAAASGVAAIAAGRDHALALKIDGSVVGWGEPYFFRGGMLRDATNNVKAIAANWIGSLFVKSDGSVVGWGDPGWEFPFPEYTSIVDTGVVAVALGFSHALALKEDGSVVRWGHEYPFPNDVPVSAQSGVVAIAGLLYYSLALKADGSVVSWPNAELAPATLRGVFGIAARDRSLLRAFLGVPAAPEITQAPDSVAVSAGRSIDLNVVATGFPLVSFQWQKDGIDIPGATNPTISLPWVQADEAGAYTVVVSNSLGVVTSAPPAVVTVNPAAVGAVIGWGDNPAVPPAAYEGVTAIAAGGLHGVALKADGTVVAWGHSEGGYGNGTNVPAGLRGVTAIAAGWDFTLALRFDGSVVAWGDNAGGRTDVPILARRGVIAIAAGRGHSLALKNDGSVVAWGSDFYYQSEVPPAARSNVIAVAAGWDHSVALKSDGSVIAWGGNRWGQATVPLAAQSGVIAIAAGNYHTLALKADGSVVAWGKNNYGEINVPLAAQSGVIAITAGGDHSAVLKSDGSMVVWGAGHSGQAIVPEVARSGVTAIAAGANFTLALLGGVSPAPVPLKVKSNSIGLTISWPAVADKFRLQFSTNLTPPVAWTDCPDPLSVVDSEFVVTNAFSTGARFYRLAADDE